MSAYSHGRRIRIDKYETAPAQSKSAVLVLHGAGGILFDGPEMRRVSRRLAEAGNTVYLVHYFNRTGTIVGLARGMQKNFETWLETVRDCIVSVQKERGDASLVGLYGYSLGAFLAVAAASNNPEVGALVEHAGGIWNGKMERVKRMPPALLIHGEADRRVPFQKYAQPLVALLRERGANFETRFFPEEGHVFSAEAMAQVRDAAAGFFARHLAPKRSGVAHPRQLGEN
ncbi:MAG TPA: dienelactone hydrolase family protein [Chthoniobacterales bacterium]